MNNIDERIVQMKFDNANFEENASRTLGTLDKLKEKLKFQNATDGLEGIENASNNVKMEGLNQAIDGINNHFSLMGRISQQVLQKVAGTISDKVIQFGRMATGIDQLSAGFGKFEQKTSSVATIMSATGKSIDEVSTVLTRLNHYTDETSYNFIDMVNNIGKFTAAGVDLDVAERAMEGIASEAAKSGANAAEASRAMYNFSQAIGTGTVKLMDWKSIENANMATKEFKQTIIDTAIEVGTLTDAGEGAGKTAEGTAVDYKNFNNALSEGWFTSEVLTKTLEKYADTTTEFGLAAFHAAQEAKTFTDVINAVNDAVSTGWMQTFEAIFGNYNEAKTFWTDMANDIIDITDKFTSFRVEAAQTFDTLGGSSALRNGIIAPLEALDNSLESVSEGIGRAFFPKKDAAVMARELKGINKQTDFLVAAYNNALNNTQIPLEERKKQLEDITEQLQKAYNVKPLLKLTQAFSDFGDKIRDLTDPGRGVTVIKSDIRQIQSAIDHGGLHGDALDEARENLKELNEELEKSEKAEQFMETISDITYGLSSFGKVVLDFITSAIKSTGKVLSVFKLLGEPLADFVDAISNLGAGLKDSEENAGTFEKAFDKVADVLIRILTPAVKILGGVIEFVANLISAIDVKVNGGILTNISEPFAKFLEIWDALKTSFMDSAGPFIEKMGQARDNLREFFDGFRQAPSDDVEDKTTAFQKFLDVCTKIATFVGTLGGTLVNWFATISEKVTELFGKKRIKIDLEHPLKTIGELLKDTKKLVDLLGAIQLFKTFKNIASVTKGLKGIFGGTGSLLDSFNNSFKAFQVSTKADTILKIAGSIGILVASIVALSKIETGDLIKSVITIVGLFALILEAYKQFEKLVPVTEPIKKEGGIEGLIENIIGVKLDTSPVDDLIKMAGSIAILALTLSGLAKLKWSEIGRGLAGLGGVVLIMLGAAYAMSKMDKMPKGMVGMIAFAKAVKILGETLVSVAQLSWGELARGLVGMGVAIAALTIAVRALNGVKLGLGMGIKIMEIATSVVILAAAAKIFSKMNWEELGKGLAGVAGMLAAVGVFAKVLGDKKNGVSSFKMLAIGTSMIPLAASLVIMAGAVKILAGIDGDKLSAGLMSLVGILVSVGAFMTAMEAVGPSGLGFAAIAGSMVVMGAAVAIFAADIAILGNMELETLAKGIGAIAAAFTVIGIAGALLGPIAPQILALSLAITAIGVGCLAAGAGLTMLAFGLSAIIGMMTVQGPAAIAAFTSMLTILLDWVISSGQKIQDAIYTSINAFLDAIVELIPKLVDTGMQILVGILQGIEENVPKIVTEAVLIVTNFVNAIAENLQIVIDAGINLVVSFINGMAVGLSEHADEMRIALTNFVTSLGIMILELIEGTIGNIPVLGDQINGKLDEQIQKMKDSIASSSEELKQTASDTTNQVAAGVDESAPAMEESSSSLIDYFKEGITNSSGGLNFLGNDITDLTVDGIKEKFSDVTAAGEGTTKEYDKGIDSKKKTVKSYGHAILNAAYEGAEDTNGLMKSRGDQAGKGYYDGVQPWIAKVKALWAEVINQGAEATAQAQESHSPSRLFMKLGSFAGQGYYNGIASWGNKISSVSASMADNGLSAMQDSIDYAMGVASDSMNANPVITPVIDLTNVRNSAGEIDSLMHSSAIPSGNYTYKIAGSVASAGSQKLQNGSVDQSKTITIAPQITINGDYTSEQGAAIARDIDRQLGALL